MSSWSAYRFVLRRADRVPGMEESEREVAADKAKEIGGSIEQVQKDATGNMAALSKQVRTSFLADVLR